VKKGGEREMRIAKQFALIFTIMCVIAIAGTVQADELKVRQPNQTEIGKIVTCPVMNSKFEVRKDTQVIDYKGKSYYFCCAHCVGDFKKNPDNYAAAGELPLRQPTQSEIGKSATCPVSNSKFEVAQDTPVIDYKGKSYYFCCSSCIEDFKKDPDKYAK
jgi:YHS domain-containing protein